MLSLLELGGGELEVLGVVDCDSDTDALDVMLYWEDPDIYIAERWERQREMSVGKAADEQALEHACRSQEERW